MNPGREKCSSEKARGIWEKEKPYVSDRLDETRQGMVPLKKSHIQWVAEGPMSSV